jgi:hypothetical protein
MVMFTTAKPDNAVPLQGKAGAPYEPLTESDLNRASVSNAWVTLAMQGGSSQIAIRSIDNIRRVSKGDATLNFTCQDITGTAYYGTITRDYTTFGRIY